MRLLLTNFHGGDGGGHTTYLLALARGLLARGHAVHLAVPAGSRLHREGQAIAGLRVHAQTYPNGLRGLPRWPAARRRLRALLQAHRIELVHVNGTADHRLAIAALRGLHPRPALVWTKHNSKPVRSLGHRLRARRTDRVLAVSAHTARQLAASPYGCCAIDTVPNGVDLQRFAPWPPEAARAARRQWVERDDALALGSNAGTADYKGWLDLVEALALLEPHERAQVRVLLAGKPPSAEASARVEALGLAAQVRFVGLLDDVRPFIAALDAGFVLSWDVETISFACREMMAMGKPVLVSDYAGLPENVEPGRDGWIVPVRDRGAIAAAIRAMLAQRERLAAMGAAARAHAEREFGLARFVELTEAAYRRALAAAAH